MKDSTESTLSKIYYSPRGYWKGQSAIKKLAEAAKVSEKIAKDWLSKQDIWQVYLPAPKYIPRPKFDIPIPNEAHQADLLFMPHDKSYKYALTVVDVGSRYKEAQPLKTKDSKEVATAFEKIYKRSPLTWPKLLQVDPGREFMGHVTQLMNSHNTIIRRGRKEIHRDQGIVERFNRTLAERLFAYQYHKEFDFSGRNTEWVDRLPAVVAALNNEETRLTGKKPLAAIKLKYVKAEPSAPMKKKPGKKLPLGTQVRYLYQPGELEGGRKRATDPIWSVNTYPISGTVSKKGEPVVYYLSGPKRGFVREELYNRRRE